MENNVNEFFSNFKKAMPKVKQMAPDAMDGFMGLFQKTMGDGALTTLQKEFVALGIGVAIQCEPCIRLHTQKCLDAGATKEQIMEAASVAVMMAGGPGYVHLPMVIETLEALQE